MSEPRQPPDPPQGGASPAANPAGQTPSGIPEGIGDHEPKGRPTSDREQTESAADKI